MVNFQEDIINKSQATPLLVDFWAPWCGPCQVLGPVLEALAKEQSEWELIKINVDENPSISKNLGIKGIPDVRLYVKGKEKARFTGALPKYQIEKWLNENLPNAVQIEFEELINNKRISVDEIRKFYHLHSDFLPAKIEYAKRILIDNPAECLQLIRSWPLADIHKNLAEAIELLSFWMINEIQIEGPVVSILSSAKHELKRNALENTAKLLIDAVRLDKDFEDGLPRKLSIAFFTWLGPNHPVSSTYRRVFDRSLY